jgi:hypothetical protein
VVPELDHSYRNFTSAWQGFHDVICQSYVDAFDELRLASIKYWHKFVRTA